MKIKKISIGANIINGPWGGGNSFFKNFINYFESQNIEVINHLADHDIDVILLTDPRKDSISSSFTYKEIKLYKKYVNKNVYIIHRINECDQRKGTSGINRFYIKANRVADLTIFVSNWLQKIYINDGFKSNSKVILGGGDSNLFKNNKLKKWDTSEKFKIVSHHWSDNYFKGFETYQKINDLIEKSDLGKKLEFTYIGKFKNKENFKNIKFIEPIYGETLVNELNKHHIYVTGSINEPSGNHHIEAAQCGLPILYQRSGGIPEYCDGFGLDYNLENIESKIKEIMHKHDYFLSRMEKYSINNESMFKEYEKVLQDITSNNLKGNFSYLCILYFKILKNLNKFKLKVFS